MNHALVLPVLLPLVTACLLILCARLGIELQRFLSLTAAGLSMLLAIVLLAEAATGARLVYHLGGWPAPYGIVLVLDRLSALMVLLTAVLGAAALTYCVGHEDLEGPRFHVLFQFQLMGVNGAFLTGDVFNLFVFFEVLLIASYALLMHGGGPRRSRAALHFVILNLVASTVFLVALAAVYAGTGTLNMADMALTVAAIEPGSAGLVRAGGLLLLLVFGFKAALLPLGFWLPGAYASASAPVACLFAIMTKVGVYAIMRVHTLVFGASGGAAADLADPWLLPLALGTIVAGTLGVLASHHLRQLAAHLVVVSVGMLLAAVGLGSEAGLAAASFYLVHSTLVGGGLFLVVDMIARQRGNADDALARSRMVAQPAALGTLFFIAAIGAVGLPPLAGFAGKLFILRAGIGAPAGPWLWAIALASGGALIVALSRAGSAIFWRPTESVPLAPAAGTRRIATAATLVGGSFVLMLLGNPVSRYAAETAAQLVDGNGYVIAVMSNIGVDAPAHLEEVPR